MPHPVVTFSVHARDQMALRRVTEADVELALAHLDNSYLGRRGNMVAERRMAQGHTLVVYEDRLDDIGQHTHVITVWVKER